MAEIFRFADDAVETGAVFVPPLELAEGATRYDAIVVDEAAQLPVPLLKRLTRRHPDAHMLFATTTRGYEGTGRGFVLRFLEELERNPRPLRVHRLTDPIRFDADDALEALVFDVLCLDARSAEDGAVGQKTPDGIVHRVLGQDEIAGDERLLRDFFGLLVHAHYRTTPSDLHRLLDAPNLRLHSLERDGRVVAACIAAIEGNLAPEICDALYWGRRRVRGHALPETLICHSGESSAGGLSFVRSVRIATHPALRRQGLATRLVAEIHAAYAPDFFGTLFGATAELLEFRRSVGYELVRVGASRGTRTGEPAAVMLRPVSIEARAIFDRLRGVLARDLPELLTLARSDGDLLLDAELEASLLAGLPAPRPLDEDERAQIVQAYAHGPRTFEAAATALASFVAEPSTDTDRLSSVERDLLRARLEQRAPWPAAARAAGFETVPSAMRALRRAVAKLIAE